MANEKRLIDADEILKKGVSIPGCVSKMVSTWDIVHAPTVDAVEVVHGRWKKTKEQLGWNEVDAVECSICHESWLSDEDDSFDYLEHWFYCPNCGAKMDGDGNV